jgi:beta-galactosidase
MKTKWLEVYRNSTLSNVKEQGEKSFGLRFGAGEDSFAFSCIPYTPEELENATHQEELPTARRTVVSILGAVRGVGGINSWGADVEEAYHISGEKDIQYSFTVEGVPGGKLMNS